VGLVHLGCAKNQVDSEVLLGRLATDGAVLCGDLDDADVAIVNTCAFIGPAREESMAAIRGLLERKRQGALRGVIVAGCLTELYRPDLEANPELREVDGFLGLTDSARIAEVVRAIDEGRGARTLTGGAVKPARPEGARLVPEKGRAVPNDGTRILTGPRSYAYLRISEGCDHDCAFCVIPTIRGRHRSKPLTQLRAEAAALVDQGVREIVLVAEDSTWYGRDLSTGERLPDAIRAVADTPGVRWVRTMYAYPNGLPKGLTEVLREHPIVVEYLDIPVQHIATGVLRGMRRASSGEKVKETLAMLRQEVPGIALRTTILVGFPGETERDFTELLDFVRAFKFERLGAFRYSPEKGTAAFEMGAPVPAVEADRRLDAVMRAQRDVVLERNRALVGTTVEVLVDELDARGAAVGRTRHDAPEIDCGVKVLGKAAPRQIFDAKVVGLDGDGYDPIVKPIRGAEGARKRP
jgi:ribosomal protein S12 methylthiotransferase